jgi:hypothetical protein
MHEVLHIGILASTLLGAAGLVLLVLWPLFSDQPLPRATRLALAGLIGLGAILFLVEWRLVH